MTLIDDGPKIAGIRLERAPRRVPHDELMRTVMELRARAPKGTPLDSMDARQLKEMLGS